MEAGRIDELSAEEVVKIEEAEKGINTFIEKRAQSAKDERDREELWQKSVKEHHEKHRNRVAEQWYAYHDRLIKAHENSLGSLILYHRQERARYARLLGLPEEVDA